MLDLQSLDYAPATAARPLLTDVSLKADIGRPVLLPEPAAVATSLLEVIAGLVANSRAASAGKGKS